MHARHWSLAYSGMPLILTCFDLSPPILTKNSQTWDALWWGAKPPTKKKYILIFFLWGRLWPPIKEHPGSGNFFLGLVDSSLTGSRSTAYQNRPGFSVYMHRKINWPQFTNCLKFSVNSQICWLHKLTLTYIYIKYFVSPRFLCFLSEHFYVRNYLYLFIYIFFDFFGMLITFNIFKIVFENDDTYIYIHIDVWCYLNIFIQLFNLWKI